MMAGKRLNKKLVVFVTLAGFLTMIVLSLLMLKQLQQRDPQYFIELAKRHEETGEWKSAALFYQRAWQRTQDASFLVSHGDMMLADGELNRAVGSWRQALIHQPDLAIGHERYVGVLLDLARLYHRIGDFRLLHEAAEAFLASGAAGTPPQEAFARHAAGLALIGLTRQEPGNLQEGEQALSAACELDPDEVTYAVDLARHDQAQGRLDDSERRLKGLVAKHTDVGPAGSQARLAYASLLAADGHFDEAEEQFKAGLDLAAGDPEALQAARLGYAGYLAGQYARTRRAEPSDPEAAALFDKSEAILRECIAVDAEPYEPYVQLAALYSEANRFEDVVALCEQRLAGAIPRGGVHGSRNRVNAFSLMVYASQACVSAASEETVDQDDKEGWLSRADAFLADARGEFAEHPRVPFQAARVKLARGLEREALADLRDADDAYKSFSTINWDQKLTLASLHLRLREPGAAKDVLDAVLLEARRARAGDLRFWTLYANVLYQTGELDRALSIVEQILVANAGYVPAVQVKAAIFERQGRGEDAGRLVGDRVLRALLRAQEKSLDGDRAQAVELLLGALKLDPTDVRLVGSVVRLLVTLERRGEAEDVVDHALAKDPENVKLQTLSVLTRENQTPREQDEAMLGVINGQEDAFQRTLDLVGFYWNKNDAAATLPLIDAALLHLAAKDTPLARSATVSQHRALLTAKLSVAAALDDTPAMKAARDDAATFNVDGVGGATLLGLYHMHQEAYDLAIDAFTDATTKQPTDARSLSHLGHCLQLAGRSDEALPVYKRAVRIGPNEGQAHKGLAALARARGDDQAYRTALSACRRLIPTDPWVQAALLEEAEKSDPRGAIVRRETRLLEHPDDASNLRRLAALYESETDTPNADRCYAKLLGLRPDDKAAALVVSDYYRRTNRAKTALDVVTRFAESRPSAEERAEAQILVASHYLKTGDLDAVERTLLEATEASETQQIVYALGEFYLRRLDDPQRALPWLDKAIAKGRANDSLFVAPMSVTRITCLLHPKLNDQETAQRYVNDYRIAFPDKPEGLRFESELHARNGDIAQAIDSLTEFLRHRPDNTAVLYQRALHHNSQGRTVAAVSDLEAVKRIDKLALDLAPRLMLARIHRLAGRRDLWVRELKSLVDDAPNHPRALDALVKAYTSEQRFPDARRLLTARINTQAASPDPGWLFLRAKVALAAKDGQAAINDVLLGARLSGFSAEGGYSVLGVYLQLDQPDAGITFYEQHRLAEQVVPRLTSRYARLLAAKGRHREAVGHFRLAMTQALWAPDEATGPVIVDVMAAFPLDEAVERFEDNPPTDEAGRANDWLLARLYVASKRYAEAATRWDHLIATCHDDRRRAILSRELGTTHLAAGNLEPARAAYAQALSYDSKDWITLNNLAYLLSDRLGDHVAAKPFALRAVASIDLADAHDTLGWIYVGLGDHTEAIATLSHAILLDPDKPLIYYHLGEAYRRSGRFTDADDLFTSGRERAQSTGDADLVSRFTASLERVAGSDQAP